MTKQSFNIQIDRSTILFIVGLLLFLKFLQLASGILITLFIAYLISVAIYPSVEFLKKYRIPRSLSAGIMLFTILILILTAVGSMIPPVIAQTSNFLQRLPQIIEQLGVYNIDVSAFTSQFGSLPGNLLKVAINTFSAAIFLTTIMVIAYYFIRERPNLENHLKLFFGAEDADRLEKTILDIEIKLGAWVRGELFLMIIIGVMTYVGLTLIGIEYALPLAIIAGLLELIPNLGPTLATIPAAIVGFATSPLHGFLVIGLSIIVQQLENNFIVPGIMKKTIGLHPVVTIVALLIGFRLGGAMLAVLSLPLVLTLQAILKHYFSSKFPKNSPILTS